MIRVLSRNAPLKPLETIPVMSEAARETDITSLSKAATEKSLYKLKIQRNSSAVNSSKENYSRKHQSIRGRGIREETGIWLPSILKNLGHEGHPSTSSTTNSI